MLALCLTLSLAGAAFAENEPSGDSSSAVSQAVSSVESEPQTQDETVSSDSASGEDQTAAKTESTPAPTETPAASDVAEEEPESTPEPEAATEPDTTPAPTEDPVADVTENEESDGSVEYTAALETDGETMNVIVTAPEGAFAEDVQPKLSVTMLTAEDELNAVADELDAAEVAYDGFAALDITFTDEATGEEVEPVKSVTVRIELPQTIVDSGVDLTTLAVQHLEEDENGNVQKVTEVATLDNGITLSEEAAAAVNEAAGVAPVNDMPAEEATAGDAAETPAAVAEFEVDGFSTFTLTYSYYHQLEIQVVDLNGTAIGQNGNSTIGTSWKSVQDIANDIVSTNKIPTDKYRFDHAEIRDYAGKNTTIKWIKFKEENFFGGSFRYSTKESKPNSYESGVDVSSKTVYFVFKNIDGGDSGEGGGEQKDSVNWDDLPNPSTENKTDKTVVNFYLNLYSTIANSDESGGGSAVDKENFTTSVMKTYVKNYPAYFEYTKEYDKDGGLASYVVIQGNTNGSAYEADAEIRTLKTGSTQGFTLADFPSDEEVFNTIKSNWNTYTKGNGIKITQSDGTIKDVKASELTTDNYTIRWYVFKYNLSDAWHVDGILVPKYGRLSVTKTFTFEGSALQSDNELSALVPENYTIAVWSSKNSYTLQMKQSTPTDSLEAPGWNSRNVDLSKGTVTYTWEVDVLDDTYTIQEKNYKDVDGYSFSNATYTTTPYNGSESQATAYPEDNGFTIKCATTETDAGDTARQSAALTNTYSKSVGSLEITKVIEGLTDDLASKQSFTFTITPSAGLTVDWGNVTATDGSNNRVTISTTPTGANVALTGSGTVTISNLPLGSYTVEEETPSNLDDYYYDYNEFNPTDKTVEVKANQPGKIKVTNHYGEYKSLTVKKTVAGNMVVDSDTFNFAIKGIEKDQISKSDNSIVVAEGDGDVIVTMKGNQQVVIEKLKDDDEVTIIESDSGDGYTPSIDLSEVAGYTVDSGTVSHPGFKTTGTNIVTVDVNQVVSENSNLGLIVFVNTRNVPVPTGLEDNHTKPFGLMVGVAVMAGLALAGGAVVRRRRRWME